MRWWLGRAGTQLKLRASRACDTWVPGPSTSPLDGSMQESPFGFRYSWSDLQPVRPLMYCVLGSQLAGALCSWGLYNTPADTFTKLWIGGALATFPGFLLGLAVQWQVRPAALSENATMIRRLGLIAMLLCVAAAAMLLGVLPSNNRWRGP
jgi:hypothetical protein